MVTAPPHFPVALLKEKVEVYLRARAWSSPNPAQSSYMESFTPDVILVKTYEEGASKPEMSEIRAVDSAAWIEVEGVLVRRYETATGERRQLTDRWQLRCWADWKRIDPESDSPLGECHLTGQMQKFK
ncbi:MAG: hypothetical protein V4662_17730 [Verrucomicrobiota bacterium]